MRDIRFRVWEKPQEGFNGKMWSDNDPKFWAECLMNTKDEYELMEYTGLKDKNGVLVYEGDIVSFRKIRRLVGFRNGKFGVFLGNDLSDFDDRYEIIGNVWENPDLTK